MVRLAAKRRKNAAHGASRGSYATTESPDGAAETIVESEEQHVGRDLGYGIGDSLRRALVAAAA